MIKNIKLFIKVEEQINRRLSPNKPSNEKLLFGKINDNIASAIDTRMNRLIDMETNENSPLYSLIEVYIRRLKNDKYIKKNGEINGASFCRDAFIDKSTWSDIRYGNIVPNKKTLLKLIIALRLSEDEANDLMAMGSNSLNPSDPRDIVILALIDIKCYDIYDVYDVLEEYGKNGKRKFENIYDMKE